MNIPFSLRNILNYKEAQNIIAYLYKKREAKDKIRIFLPIVTKKINDHFEKVNAQDYYRNEEIPDYCFDQNDLRAIPELGKLGALKIIIEPVMDDDGTWWSVVLIRNSSIIEEIYAWTKDIAYILSYGIFSLNTLIGESYCGDYKTKFHTSRGFYRVFKAFLENPNHELSFKEILSNHQDKPEPNDDSRAVHEIIVDLRKKLRMKGKLSKLLIPTGKAYKLLPNI